MNLRAGPDFEHLRAAHRAGSFGRRPTVLHRDWVCIRDLARCLAFHAIAGGWSCGSGGSSAFGHSGGPSKTVSGSKIAAGMRPLPGHVGYWAAVRSSQRRVGSVATRRGYRRRSIYGLQGQLQHSVQWPLVAGDCAAPVVCEPRAGLRRPRSQSHSGSPACAGSSPLATHYPSRAAARQPTMLHDR